MLTYGQMRNKTYSAYNVYFHPKSNFKNEILAATRLTLIDAKIALKQKIFSKRKSY